MTYKQWYVVHTYSGFENRVKSSIEERARQLGVTERFGQVLVPTEDVIEIRDGKKRISTKKFFPGYVLVEMNLDEVTVQMIKETPKVTGFIGGGLTPAPLSDEEVTTMLQQMGAGSAHPRSKMYFSQGDDVRIIDGPFLGFNGVVDEVDNDHNKVKVLVSIFGRSTPVELQFFAG